ncbi:MAG: D-glycerate dehydrogenase [Planctomycetota bacterium]|nr:D-glycerate dehydrogenase [Planctomycetota bacterium]
MMFQELPRVIADGPLSHAVSVLLEGRVELLPWQHLLGQEDETVSGIYTFGHPVLTGDLMDKAPNVKVISNHGVGVDHISLKDAQARGIPVGNTPGVLDGATADMGFCLLMAAARRLVEGVEIARFGVDQFKPKRSETFLGREIHGASLGIVGLGRIGLQVARRAAGFDMHVSYYNRNRRTDIESKFDVTYKPLHELLATCDYIMLCVPLTDETKRLIGVDQLRLMRPTATLINIARGAVVDTDALTIALTENWIYAAGLDVTDPEPLPKGHPLLELDNVIVAPHIGSATVQTRQKMAELSVQNLLAGIAGAALPNRIA